MTKNDKILNCVLCIALLNLFISKSSADVTTAEFYHFRFHTIYSTMSNGTCAKKIKMQCTFYIV